MEFIKKGQNICPKCNVGRLEERENETKVCVDCGARYVMFEFAESTKGGYEDGKKN